MDADSKIITDYATTSANIHDSNEFSEFLGEDDKVVYADSAYVGKEIPNHVENRVCEKGYRGKPLTDEQKESNRRKSKIRCRIEHVFGFITVSMHGLTVRSIGIKRAEFNIGLTNLVYNFCRYTILKRKEVCIGYLCPNENNSEYLWLILSEYLARINGNWLFLALIFEKLIEIAKYYDWESIFRGSHI